MNIEMVDKFIGSKVNQLLNSHKKSKALFARLLDLSPESFLQCEKGKASFHPLHLQKIATAFNLSINYFLEGIADSGLGGEQLYDVRVSKADFNLFNNLTKLPLSIKHKILHATNEKAFQQEILGCLSSLTHKGGRVD